MVWKSSTFKRSDAQPATLGASGKIKDTVNKHRSAMDGVVESAKRFRSDRAKTASEIKDPDLRKGAVKR